ncbi:ornithine cyclodeaminase family protein [Nonomuraea sp. M3C6]|uniref:Ornithine cyclodeaminase family protein n=1 Tax=Nonomuraea marmarensis TaxID=3351344 RepID=A0ABW7AWA1_9ACTN
MSDLPQTRVLGMSDVRRLLTVEDSIEVQRQAFLALAHGHVTAAPNAWLRLPGDQRGWLKLLAAHDKTSGGLGVKVLARFPRNPPGRNLGSLLLLFDDETGTPLAVMDSVYITAVRTAAGAALATQALARPESRSVAMIGTGALAWYSLLAHRHLLPALGEMTVYSRSAERREAFAERAAAETGVEARAVGTVAEAVAGADIVITATNSPVPVLLREHLEPGQHVGAIGIRTEMSPDAVAMCRVIGDGREETLQDGKFSVALAAGAVRAEDLGPGLGDVLDSGPGRRDTAEITMFDSSGVAIQDIACAVYVWRAAREEDAGTIVDLGAKDVLAL